ncbi:hypothetical protein LCGC14_1127220 [marine sediment metagenome]|uniref:Uncharacterized protein n=1 Tax=marine sediment metagenome TaxID=412755 RepID=A0A0F9Q800_9ZZZZ
MYKITITKTEVKEVTVGKEWEKQTDSTEVKTQYGYTPEITKKKELTTTILTQEIEELDLPGVIKAINKL